MTSGRHLDQLIAAAEYDPSVCVFRNLKRATRRVEAFYDEALRASGLNSNQFTILITLARKPDLNVQELARLVSLSPSTVPRVTRPLVRDGLLAVRPGDDRRVRVISITGKGRRRLARAFPLWEKAQRHMLEILGARRWTLTRKRLADLRYSLEEE